MKIKESLIVLFLFGTIFSQSVSYWESNRRYNRGDTVYLDGIRYIATRNIMTNYTSPRNGSIFWHRIVPFRFPLEAGVQTQLSLRGISDDVQYTESESAVQPRLVQSGHEKLRDRLLNDEFVKKVLEYCNYSLDFVDNVGLQREKHNSSDILHSSWNNFMVNDWNTETVRELIEQGHNPDSLMRNVNITRRYNRYKNDDRERPWRAYGGTRGAFEQIIHNIGDAGVPYNHALSGFLSLGGNLELDYEIYVGTRLSPTCWDNLQRTYFPGSIYDAISLYGKRTLETLLYRRDNDVDRYRMAAGNRYVGHPVWGVMRNAFAVGRFILVDAILADLPLMYQRIMGSPFVVPNEPHTLTAYAKDPDAVLFLHRNNRVGENGLTDTSELLIPNIFGEYNLWHEPSAHPMTYKWDFSNNGNYDTLGSNITFTIEIPQGLTLNDLNLRDNRDRQVRMKVEGRTDPFPVRVRNTLFTVKVKITDDEGDSAIVRKQLTLSNTIPIVAEEFRKGNTNRNPYIVQVRNNIHLRDGNEYFYQDGVSEGGNRIRVLSGFTNPESYEKVYVNFFKSSFNSDKTASDQIIAVKLNFDNINSFEWRIEGVNQYIDTIYYFTKDGKKDSINEQRIVINNNFWLESGDNNKITAFLDQHFASSVWENNSSPAEYYVPYPNIAPNKNHTFRVKVQDSRGFYSDETLVKLPILTPPTIKRVRLSTSLPMSGWRIIETYNAVKPITLQSGGDMVLMLEAEAYDPDHGENARENLLGISAYKWSIREKVIGANTCFWDIDFLNTDLRGRSLTFTHRELRELLGSRMKLGATYEVFLRVEDDDRRITGDSNGFAITKVGGFILENSEDYWR